MSYSQILIQVSQLNKVRRGNASDYKYNRINENTRAICVKLELLPENISCLKLKSSCGR